MEATAQIVGAATAVEGILADAADDHVGGADVLVGGGGIDDCSGGAGSADVADPSCEAQVAVP